MAIEFLSGTLLCKQKRSSRRARRKLRKQYLWLALVVFLLASTSTVQVRAQQPTVSVFPELATVPSVGLEFTVKITVQDIVNLAAWEFRLYYPNDILNGTSVTEGPFLRTEGTSTFFMLREFTDSYNETHGRIAVFSLRLNLDEPAVDGNGVLATITFKSKAKGGPSLIHLANVTLADPQANEIPCFTVDGEVEVNDEAQPIQSPLTMSDLRLTIESPENQLHFIYADPRRMTRAVATYDVASGGVVVGMCHNSQQQGFDTNSQWVSQEESDKGRLLFSEERVFMFAGPTTLWCVNYLEGHRLTPVYFNIESRGDQSYLKFIENSTGTAKVDRMASSIDFEHEDYFVFMALADQNNNKVFIGYGFDWKGTWSTGIYFKTIYPNIEAYTRSYYIMHWVDLNGDGIPQTSEMAQIASG